MSYISEIVDLLLELDEGKHHPSLYKILVPDLNSYLYPVFTYEDREEIQIEFHEMRQLCVRKMVNQIDVWFYRGYIIDTASSVAMAIHGTGAFFERLSKMELLRYEAIMAREAVFQTSVMRPFRTKW